MEEGGGENWDAKANRTLPRWDPGLQWGVGTEAWKGSCILETGLWLQDGEWVGEGKTWACLGSQAKLLWGSQSLGREETFNKMIRIKTVWPWFKKRNLYWWWKGKQGWSQNKTTADPRVFSKIQNWESQRWMKTAKSKGSPRSQKRGDSHSSQTLISSPWSHTSSWFLFLMIHKKKILPFKSNQKCSGTWAHSAQALTSALSQQNPT